MNKILLKAIEELKKETFSKEYVLGMLETLVEMQGEGKEITSAVAQPGGVVKVMTYNEMIAPVKEASEAEMLDKLAAARLREVEEMSTIDVVTPK